MKNIINRLINIFKPKDELHFLKVGDIIWANRYQNIEEQNKLPIGHQKSPYIIISKEKNKTYALQCTSNPHNNVKWESVYHFLNKMRYNLEKNCYISTITVHELSKSQYLNTIGHLTDYDLNKVIKKLYIVTFSDFLHKPEQIIKKFKFTYEIGDIIEYQQDKYYIKEIDDKNFTCYKLNKKLKQKNRILINNTYYSLYLNNTFTIKKNNKIKLINTFNTSEIKLIENYINNQINKNNQKISIPTIGCLIIYNNNLYYIINEDDEYFTSYRIHTSSDKNSNMAIIKIKGGLYYTNFNEVKLSKEKTYKIKRQATSEEINYNSNLIKLSKTQIRKLNSKLSYRYTKERTIDDFIPMTIIYNQINKKNYLILSRENNTVELVNINDIKDYYYFELEKNNCPYEYYRIISEEEFLEYKNKVYEIKQLADILISQNEK